MLNYSLRPDNRGRDLAGSWQYMFDTYPYLKSWKDSLQNAGALKDTFIYAPDDVKMHAYYVAAAQPTAKNRRHCSRIYRQRYPHDDDWLHV